ncbi:MAG: 5-(carboxyamino)imidazole ribonucleotide mutase [Coriobacteriales bacterium]|jgi:5-(carboxyamino)imidazole ribonucleotide mutase|nr:5-(carboxyamino)imidazole ribonucleotide mutase [Coriobacteriales bacterium]
MSVPLVGVIVGSESDLAVMQDCTKQLEEFKVPYGLIVASAHRNPRRVQEWADTAEERGIKVIIAAAGKAAHLAGVVASHTSLPVIAVPIKTSDLGGLDSLLSTVQMPGGVPVACVAINGARNAAILATQILATGEHSYKDTLKSYKEQLAV